MYFMPIDRMQDRVNISRDDGDMSLFMNLTYLGEMVIKCVVAGLVAGVVDNHERSRYKIIYNLIRADGLGGWDSALEEILKGPTAQYLSNNASDLQRELTQRVRPDNWQYESVALLQRAMLSYGGIEVDEVSGKVEALRWFSLFVQFRNKTKAHGAPQSGKCSVICNDLEKSINLIIDNLSIFSMPWAFLHQNLSGKYRIARLTSNASCFDNLKSAINNKSNFADGIYIHYDKHYLVELMVSDPDLIDFYFPNGQFSSKKYEILSYITEDKKDGDSSLYLTPPSQLPESETKGKIYLSVQGNCYGNIPQLFIDYVHRVSLENKLLSALNDDRHPIVTLVGRGGIGKTWLAINVLHQISESDRFTTIVWFSARDIDLTLTGPKQVKPNILDEKDVAEQYVKFVDPPESSANGFKPLDYLQTCFSKNPLGPTLFVFDNFETVRNPVEFFTWIDTYIRLPNKVLITTRFREFVADYPIEVEGMEEEEVEELISKTADKLGIKKLVVGEYKDTLIIESEGHPYVIKILLGEWEKNGKPNKIERIVAGRDEILKALFERTYNALSPAAKRVFLTLSNWHSIISKIAIEAVLLRSENERMDVSGAVDELKRSSFIETIESDKDHEIFLSVPLVAMVFGKKKLSVSPMKSAVEGDTILLQVFGNVRPNDVREGLEPRIKKLFQNAAQRINKNNEDLKYLLPILEFIAGKYPPAWLLLASLYEEIGKETYLEKAKQTILNYIENSDNSDIRYNAWCTYKGYCVRSKDYLGEIHAIVELSQLSDVPFQELSNYVNRINSLFKDQLVVFDSYEKEVLVTKMLDVIEKRLNEADATDFSRAAWLALNIHNDAKAREYTERGLAISISNPYINSLAIRLGLM